MSVEIKLTPDNEFRTMVVDAIAGEFRRITDVLSENVERRYLTSAELMDLLHICRTKVWSLVHHEGLPCVKLGGKLLFPQKALDEWIKARTVDAYEPESTP